MIQVATIAVLIFVALISPIKLARADCSTVSGLSAKPGELLYNVDHAIVQYCAGTVWRALGGAAGTDGPLPNLTDVDDALAPADGECLVYNGTNTQWETGSCGSGGGGVSTQLNPQSSEPATCNASTDGTLALTEQYSLCVCKSGSGWVAMPGASQVCYWSVPAITTYATLNPSDKATGVTLSNGDLWATGAWTRHVRSTIARSSGKYYFEVTLNAYGTYGCSGFSTGSASLTVSCSSVSPNQYVFAMGNNAEVCLPGGCTSVSADFPYTSTEKTVGYAVDLVNGKFHIFYNGAWLTGSNPETNSGGFQIPTGVPLYVMGGSNNAANSRDIKFNFGQSSFAYSVPGGYASGWGN